MLTYDQELELSGLIVARRKVRDLIEYEDREPTQDEAATMEAGDRAASELVEAYLPFIHKLAHSIARQSNYAVDPQDLAQEGVVAAIRSTWAFNAQGNGDRP